MQKKSILITLLFLMGAVPSVFALSSGPTMPEYNDFESVGNTDLVNLVTGGFTYSIPVMTVPGPALGFPIVLNYHGGTRPEQEASWVGLGWNIQGGAITREVNNTPDDFKGIPIQEKINSTHIYGWQASIAWNGATVGVSYNSEQGYGGMVGYSYHIDGTPFSIGGQAGVNGVYEGVGITGGLSAGKAISGTPLSLGMGLSVGIHSKNGLTAGYNYGIQHSANPSKHIETSLSLASVGASLSSSRGVSAGASLGVSMSSSKSVQGVVSKLESNVTIPFYTPATGYIEFNWGNWDIYINGLQEDFYYGFLYSDDYGMDCVGAPCHNSTTTYARCDQCKNDRKMVKKMDFNTPSEFLQIQPGTEGSLKLGYTGEDVYSVQSQGMSGTFKPYRTEDGDYYTYLSNKDYTYQSGCKYIGDIIDITCDRTETVDYGAYFDGGFTKDGIVIPSRNSHSSVSSRKENIVWRFNEEAGGALYTDPDPTKRDLGSVVAASSKKITPIYDNGPIVGWVITSADGVKYLYSKAMYNIVEQEISAGTADLKEWTRRETPGYAYAWLLTAIYSTDYVRMVPPDESKPCKIGNEADCLPQDGDLGGWVKFTYTDPKVVNWKIPIGKAVSPSSYGLRTDVQRFSTSSGMKTVSYLKNIETPTHRADFFVAEDSRSDGIPPGLPEIGFELNHDTEIKPSGIYDPTQNEVCVGADGAVKTIPHTSYTLKIPVLGITNGLPSGTTISLLGRREILYKRTEFYWGGSFFRGYFAGIGPVCKSEFQDQLMLDPITLTDAMKDPADPTHFLVTIPNTSTLQNVRVVIGKIPLNQSLARLAYLHSITLVNKQFGEKSVGEARFAYDYSLAENTPNSESSWGNNQSGDKGRLTLKGIQIGASSTGPWNPPYTFSYSNTAIKYDVDKIDYWGYYCASCSELKKTPDGQADIWNLNKIITPSGSQIEVAYEPKTIDYTEGIPTVMDGDSVQNYFRINTDEIILSGLCYYKSGEAYHPNSNQTPCHSGSPTMDPPFDETKLRDWTSIPTEIADRFKSKYVVFLGRYEMPLNSEINFTPLTAPGTPKEYVLEAPRIFAEEFYPIAAEDIDKQYNVLNYGMNFGFSSWSVYDDPGSTTDPKFKEPVFVKSNLNRISCPKMKRCSYQVGIAWPTPFVHTYFNHQLWVHTIQANSIRYDLKVQQKNTTPLFARMWAVYDKANGKPKVFGDGVRVSQVTFREPFSNKANIFHYTYYDAATPTMPSTGINYSLGIKFKDAQGTKAYLGNPAVLNGKVVTTYNYGNASNYSTEYNFLTSKDLPVQIKTTSISNVDNLNGAFKILDRSGLWGSMWKSTDKDNQGNIVRENISQWALRLDPTTKTAMGLPTNESMGLIKNGQTVLVENDGITDIYSDNTIEKKYFGITQKLWSNRYIPQGCENLNDGATEDFCIKAYKGAITTQIEVLRFNPLIRMDTLKQDGLKKYTESNLYDFQTGTPLLQIMNNKKIDGSTDYIASLHVPAYKIYPEMKDSNMLSQEFSATNFRFTTNPSTKKFMALSQTDLNQVTGSQFTEWESNSSKKPILFRKKQGFVLRDKTNFTLPTKTSVSDVKWVSQGISTYDDFGHEINLSSKVGTQEINSSKVYGYGPSLTTAYAQNAKSTEIFYQSFETDEYIKQIVGGSSLYQARVGIRSKTGSQSIKVVNCMEQNPLGTFVKKSECLDTPPNGYNQNQTMVCFNLPKLPANNNYIASAWYYDEYQGSDPSNPNSTVYTDKTTQVTRPGIFIGQSPGIAVQNFPNGVKLDPPETGYQAGAANGDWNADQRALGDKRWKKIWTEFRPNSTGVLANAMVCLYANKGKPGSDVYYDELRIKPKNALMTTYAYDAQSNMISSADANQTVTNYEHDAFGNLTGIRNENGLLLSEQAKKYGNQKETYQVYQTNQYIDGCEVIALNSTPNGYNTDFEFVSTDPVGKASFDIKIGPKGEKIKTLCYTDYSQFNLKLLLRSTGRVTSFFIPERSVGQLLINQRADGFFPDTYDGKIHRLVPNPKQYEYKYDVVHLPLEAELKQMGIINTSDKLLKYRILLEMTNINFEIPDCICYSSDIPTRAGVTNSNFTYRMHLKHNYFALDFKLDGSITGTTEDNPIWSKSRVTPNIFEVIRYGETNIPLQTPWRSDYDKFTLTKTILWDVANVNKDWTPAELQVSGEALLATTHKGVFAFALWRRIVEGIQTGIPWAPPRNSNPNIKLTITPITTHSP